MSEPTVVVASGRRTAGACHDLRLRAQLRGWRMTSGAPDLSPPPFIPAESVLQTGYFMVEPPRTMRASDYPWEHEVRVALPMSYPDSEESYPVLWVTDNALETALSVLGAIELIVVSVGAPRTAGGPRSRRRAYDFYPCEDIFPPGPIGAALRQVYVDGGVRPRGGGAARFLDFLVDEVRPALAAEYRMDADDHGIEGYSAGGWFVTYALFTRPVSFAKYIAGAPSLYFSDDQIWEIEEQLAAAHDDLAGQIFFGAGDREMTVDHRFGCLSSMVKMVERLSFRNYPSLDLAVKIFPGETHQTGRPFVISNAAEMFWGNRVRLQL